MFRLVKNLYGGAAVAPPKDNKPFTASGELAEGTVCVFNSDGKLEAAGDTADDVAVVTASSSEEDGDEIRGYYILPGMVFKADIKDGEVHDNMYIGCSTVQMEESGTEVDLDIDPEGSGYLTLLSYDEDEEYALVVFNKGAFFK